MDREPDYWSMAEVAQRLGVSLRTVTRLVARGTLPSTKVGRRRLIPRAQLQAWLHQRTQAPAGVPPVPIPAGSDAEGPTPDRLAHALRVAQGQPQASEASLSVQATAALVALLQILLPEGERRYLRDYNITALPLAQLNAVLAPLGYVIRGTRTRAANRFVLCTDAQGQVERYGLFALQRVEEEGRS